MTAVNAIILGAGRPFGGQTPSAGRSAGIHSNVLEWQCSVLEKVAGQIEFIGGYGADRIALPRDVRLTLNRNWDSTGAAHSLFMSELDPERSTVVCYADILFREEALRRLVAVPDAIAVAVDSRHRAGRRDNREVVKHDHEFGNPHFVLSREAANDAAAQSDVVGLIHIPASLMPQLRKMRTSPELQKEHLGSLLRHLVQRSVPVRLVDISGEWTDLDSADSLPRFLFGSKAETLARLSDRVKKSRVAPQTTFSVEDWNRDSDAQITKVIAAFGGQNLAVRSSAASEDGFEHSMAGHFVSKLDVVCEANALRHAIGEVVSSYDGRIDNQVLVQPMIPRVIASGVVFSRTLDRGAPYLVINYSLGSRTDIVTGGDHGSRVAYVHRDARSAPPEPIFLQSLVDAVSEIETLLDLDTLDIEFAICRDGTVHLLQVRPLTVQHDRSEADDDAIKAELNNAMQLYRMLGPGNGNSVGRKSLYGIMPDWNPAEIIGVVPRPLAASLYHKLVTGDVWASQRFEFGYRDLRGTPLMRMFAGHAYIDVRASLNSFIPRTLPDTLAAGIVETATANLERNPHLHDKIEFDVVPTCFDLAFDRWNTNLFANAGLNQTDIVEVEAAYRRITINAFTVLESAWRDILDYEIALDESRNEQGATLTDLPRIIADCRRKGVLPFAHLARCAFVAMSLLKTAVSRMLLSQERADQFLTTIRTVSHQFSDDAASVGRGELSFSDFSHRYGHLRPGTYDITSPSYGSAPERFLEPALKVKHPETGAVPFEWTPTERAMLDRALDEARLPFDAEALKDFIIRAVTGREYSKFVFTRGLSRVLETIAEFGGAHGFSRDDLSFLQYGDLEDYLLGASNGIDALVATIADARRRFKTTSSIILPPLVACEADFESFVMMQARPNFIGSGHISAALCVLDDQAADDSALEGSVAMILRADPGYDWIFTREIRGLITAFGGANSHMAIRCAEFGLPAAIGVGMEEYQRLRRARGVELDCQKQQINPH